MLGKRRGSARLPSTSPPTPLVVPTEDGPSRGPTLKRSCTTPSLRSPAHQRRSKSYNGAEAKAKERAERAEGHTGQDSSILDTTDTFVPVSAKASPQQAFRVLPGRCSAPPTPRRHTPISNKRTPRLSPRLSPRYSLGGGSGIHCRSRPVKDNHIDEVVSKRYQGWEREAVAMNKASPGERHLARTASAYLPSAAVAEQRTSTASAYLPVSGTAERQGGGVTAMPVVPPGRGIHNHQDTGSTSNDMLTGSAPVTHPQVVVPPPATPPVPTGPSTTASPHNSSAQMSPGCGCETLTTAGVEAEADSMLGRSASGTTTPTECGVDAPGTRPRDGKAQAAADSRIMKLIGRRSVLGHGTLYPEVQQRRKERQHRCSQVPKGGGGSGRGSQCQSRGVPDSPKVGASTRDGSPAAVPGAVADPAFSASSGAGPSKPSRRSIAGHSDRDAATAGGSPRPAEAAAAAPEAGTMHLEDPASGIQVAAQPGLFVDSAQQHDLPAFGASGGDESATTFGSFLPLPEDEDEPPVQAASGEAPEWEEAVRKGAQEDPDVTSGEGSQGGALIWPGRQVVYEAPEAEEDDGAEAEKQEEERPPAPHTSSQAHIAAVAAAANAVAGTAWTWPQSATQELSVPQQPVGPGHDYGLAAAAWAAAPNLPAQMLQNEAGSLVAPQTWRFVLPPPLPAPSQPGATTGGGAAGAEASETAETAVPAQGFQRDAPAPDSSAAAAAAADLAAVKAVIAGADPAIPADVEAKRRFLGDMVETLLARLYETEQALGSEQRAGRAMRVTLDVLQRQNLHLQQQLAWVTQNWQYAMAAAQEGAVAAEVTLPGSELQQES
mmetsp:Transcript_62023/g.136451  ORF Transcript_62023/g.136451 Transcript_62023/m.136451 type:complete len:832 (+) Transcript_62023:150-2645(+)